MLEETGPKVFISTVKRVLYQHDLKGRSTRKKPPLQNHHKKSYITDHTFGDMSSGLMKQKCDTWAIMTIVMCGGKGYNDHCYVWREKGEACKPKKMAFIDALIDSIMRKENYLGIKKQHFKTSARKLKLGHKWVTKAFFQRGGNVTKA